MRKTAESQIVGEFEGMDFDRIFRLTNGQEWEQVEQRYKYTYRYMPRVKIFEDGGNFFLRVDGFDEDIRVRPA